MYLYICPIINKQKKQIMKTLKEHWSERLGKLQIKNLQNERMQIGINHYCTRFKLTQLAIKFKL
jgi:cellobiose phosphorylase